MPRFRNPYNFVPFADRDGVEGPLRDSAPVGHAAYADDCWSGRLRVRGIVRTPVIAPVFEGEDPQTQHKTYKGRRTPDGDPYLPPTGLRGALRARYEAATVSRFGIADERLRSRLGYRLGTDDGARALPVRVGRVGDTLTVVPLPGTSRIPRANGDPLWGAWLPMGYAPAERLDHGAFVRARLRKFRRHDTRSPKRKFPMWIALQAVPADSDLPEEDWRLPSYPWLPKRYEPLGDCVEVAGWVFRSSASLKNRNARNKKFERLFFSAPHAVQADVATEEEAFEAAAQANPHVQVPYEDLRQSWEDVLRSYADATADRERALRGANFGPSAHVVEDADGPHRKPDAGLLAYGMLDDAGGETRIRALAPVAIGREPFDKAPYDLLPDSIDVASAWEGLSPADRVFGWVHGKAGDTEGDQRTSLRASLRIGVPTFAKPTDDEGPLMPRVNATLAILSAPKPTYAPFYVRVAGGADRNALRDVGYRDRNSLRGRKVFPRQPEAETPGWFDADGGGRGRWGSPNQSNQNRTVTDWIRPGAEFEFDIDVRNLSSAELGALLKVIYLASGDGRLRLGYGKPLGFGAVELQLRSACVETGAQRRRRLVSFDASLPAEIGDEERECLLRAFQDAFRDGEEFDGHDIGKAMLAEAEGFDDEVPVAYPGALEGQAGYKWFMANERRKGSRERLAALYGGPYVNNNPPRPQQPR